MKEQKKMKFARKYAKDIQILQNLTLCVAAVLRLAVHSPK